MTDASSKWRRYLSVLGPDPERDVADEFRFHLETEIEGLIAQGLAPDEARVRALARFGDMDRSLAECRAADLRRLRRVRRVHVLDVLRSDVRYIVRGLVNRPAFTATVILTLALGVGANAAVFTIVDRVFLRPPPGVSDPGSLRRLYTIQPTKESGDVARISYSMPEAREIQAAVDARFPTAIYRQDKRTHLALGTDDDRLVVSGWVTPGFFRVLGARLAVGREFAADELRFGEPTSVAIISWSLWQRELDGDPAALGRVIRVDSQPVTIVGIAARGFTGIDVDATDIWLPLGGFRGFSPALVRWWESRGMLAWRLIARVPDGEAEAQLAVLGQEAQHRGMRERRRTSPNAEQFGDPDSRISLGSIIVARGPTQLVQEMSVSAVLAGVAFLVLIVASANVGNMLLARSLQRRREIALRLALGISRTRLVAQIMLESIILATVSAVAAMAAASWIGGALRAALLPNVVWGSAPVDLRVVLFTLALGVIGGIAAAVLAAREMMRVDVNTVIKQEEMGRGGRRSAAHAVLIGVQAALSLVLLVGTGLLARTLYNIERIDLGYDVDRVITISARDSARLVRLPSVAEMARSLPGVSHVALTGIPPLDGRFGARRIFTRSGDTVTALGQYGSYMIVGPEYLATVGTRVIRGRDITVDDRFGAPPVVVVSQEAARLIWPKGQALGECLRVFTAGSPCYTVVGIAENAHGFKLVEEPSAVLYFPLEQAPGEGPNRESIAEGIVVRTRGDPTLIVQRLRTEMGDTVSSDPDRRVALLSETLAPQYRPWQLAARLFASFGFLALVLASLGLYSVLTYVVTTRRHEFGVRSALGAQPARLVRLVLWDGLRYVLIGIVVGVGVVIAGGRVLAALLYGVSPADPLVIGAAMLVLGVAALIAAALPALRTIRVDPMIALREQ